MRFIGFYDYTVILTYLSLVSAVLGMTFAHKGLFSAAMWCLFLSGFCDAFDGTWPEPSVTAPRTRRPSAFSWILCATW